MDLVSIVLTGSCPTPTITIVNKTNDGVLLKCKVKDASPEPVVELQDSAGNTFPPTDLQVSQKGNYFDIILLAAVTKEDNYSCVATQTEICHQIRSEQTYVILPGKFPLWYWF